MLNLANENQVSIIEEYLVSYLEWKSEDCILYSEEGVAFKMHKEMFIQTNFMRDILSASRSHYCEKIEVFCPCSTKELDYMVQFLYNGVVYCDKHFELIQLVQNLEKVFGFSNNFNIEGMNEEVYLEQIYPSSSQRCILKGFCPSNTEYRLMMIYTLFML